MICRSSSIQKCFANNHHRILVWSLKNLILQLGTSNLEHPVDTPGTVFMGAQEIYRSIYPAEDPVPMVTHDKGLSKVNDNNEMVCTLWT